LERSFEIGDYAIDKQEELRQLDQYLEQLNYNEQDALARSEKWSGGVGQKRQQIKDAQRRQALLARQPEIKAQIAQ